ncbi:MAG: GNAT family N-acetyltransferase [Brevundimonas aurantiaca]|uniref:GNAT family N-acetyltransferase n=1 Tax=Brevundimonas aurantiaca TaxID=74316 RepID=UPI00391B3F75
MNDAAARLEPPVPTFEFKRLSGPIQRGAFLCGYREIDQWVPGAHKEHKALKSRVVTAHLKGNPAVAGLYSMRIRLESDTDIAGHGKVFRTENGYFSAVQLCYLAVQRPLQGKGILGPLLLTHAIREFGEVALRTGICALTLVAADERKAAFYRRMGFETYGKPCSMPKMFYPAQSAIDLIEQTA